MPETKGTAEIARQNNLKYFDEVMKALAAYNDEHNVGHTLFKAMFRQLLREEDHEDDTEKREQAALRQAITVQPKAQALGLDWDFNTQTGIAMFGPEGNINIQELRLTISNIEKFLSFLKQLQLEDFEKNPELKKRLAVVIDILSKQTNQYYNDPDDERGHVLLNNAPLLLGEFKRLGLDDETKMLEIYFVHSRRGTLGEYRFLVDAQCFQAPNSGRFGPSEWHKDATIEFYQSKWKRCDDAVLAALKNNNALLFVKEAIANLIACANFAITDMERMLISVNDDKKHYYLKNNYPKFIQIARASKDELEQLQRSTAGNKAPVAN